MRRIGSWILVLGIASLGLSACKGTTRSVDETLSVPVRAAGAGVKAVGEGVKGIGEAGGSVVGRLLTDRNRHSLLREHEDLSKHMKILEEFLRSRGITLSEQEMGILRGARDRLAATGQQLQAPRIPADLGARIYAGLDSVRDTYDLFRRTYNAPRYVGFVAAR